MTLPPQQANTQRMRFKFFSNQKVDEGGQQPIAGVYFNGRSPNDCFSHGAHLYSYSQVWLRVGTRKWNSRYFRQFSLQYQGLF